MRNPVITRFAPAPTGHLHLGHVLNALYVWECARERGGRVLLRIEDHDRQRCRPEFETAILEDLAWLGFAPDSPMVRQSDRDHLYRAALAKLVEQGLVYGCRCTRAEIVAHGEPGLQVEHGESGLQPRLGTAGTEVPALPGPDLRYPGTCRDRGIPLTDGVGWRLRIDAGVERFVDGLCGTQEQDPSRQCGDVLLRDRLGNWTYQFAVTVDDIEQQVTDVIRGVDLLASTGRQIRLARLLGRAEPPRFTHHPLVMQSPTQKLSKSDGATGVRELRAAGWTAAEVRRHAAATEGHRGPQMKHR